jgi:MFS family permease|tara:strand:+ start:133 stop:507 length:375 start_codon:yes stop_codon:yes gene_type:complete
MVLVGAVAFAISTGLSYFGLSAHFPSLEREFGWSRTAIAGAFSLTRMESGLLGPAEAYLPDRFGPRCMQLIGTVILALGFFLFSQMNSLPMLYLAFTLFAVASLAATFCMAGAKAPYRPGGGKS